jgi:uncharacterized membrane protein YhaH (DUF805 family)
MIRRGMTSKDWGTFLTSTKGRARRYDINMFYLLLLVISLFAFAADYSYLGNAAFEDDAPNYVSHIFGLIMLWPNIALNTRRLHDLGYSGWWQLAGYLLPAVIAIVGGIVAALVGNVIIAGTITLVAVIMAFVYAIILSCARGQTGANRFGPDLLSKENV